MPLEIEIKLKLVSHTAILKRLRQLRATHIGTQHETNIFFDHPDRSLLQSNSGLRVRLETPLRKTRNSPRSPPSALLTFKGSPQSTGLGSRNAYDLTCSPTEQLIPLLKSLGFVQTQLFEKIRDSWQLAKCKIELDTLPHFGCFLEIEGPSERAVHAIQKKLALADLASITTSYATMVDDHLTTKKRKELRF
ncbi:MAG: class IV adenylate cyclase [Phycisphaerales bacterium]|nr:class IV adenylate cyclase [Phycisphaerales bacterium]